MFKEDDLSSEDVTLSCSTCSVSSPNISTEGGAAWLPRPPISNILLLKIQNMQRKRVWCNIAAFVATLEICENVCCLYILCCWSLNVTVIPGR